MRKKRRIRQASAVHPADTHSAKYKTDHLHILLVSAVLTLSALFVMVGIGIVGIQGSRNGIDPENPPVSIRQKEELLYQVSLLGETAVIDLSPFNRMVGFFHRNNFLIPAPITFIHQVITAIYLACTDYPLFMELTFP